jgi:hypothetical protein
MITLKAHVQTRICGLTDFKLFSLLDCYKIQIWIAFVQGQEVPEARDEDHCSFSTDSWSLTSIQNICVPDTAL